MFFILSAVYRKYPDLVNAITHRHEIYNETLCYIARQEQAGKMLVIRPAEKLPIGRTESDPDKLRQVYEIGRQAAIHRIDEIKAYFQIA